MERASGRLSIQAWRTLGILLVAALLTACGEARFSSDFSEDGPATHTFAVSFPRNVYERIVDDGLESRLAGVIDAANEAGFHTERIFTTETVTLLISTTVDDSRDVGAALNSLLNASGISSPAGISTSFAGEFRQETPAVGGTRFVLDMTVDGRELYDALAAISAGSPVPFSQQQLDQTVEVSYVASLPGNIHETTGEVIENDVARWEITPNGTIRIYAASNTGGLGSTTLFIVAGILSVVAAVALAALIGLLLIRRRGLSNRLVAGAGYFPRRATINRQGIWLVNHARSSIDRLWRSSGSDGRAPLNEDVLEAQEGERDGADTEGDRPVAGVHRR